MDTIKFPYKPKMRKHILGASFFALCSFALTMKALQNDEGLIINGMFELSIDGASIFFWVLASFSVLFVLLGIVIIISIIQKPKEITITDNEIFVPKSLISSKIFHIKFDNIQEIKMQDVFNERILIIIHSEGKAAIPRSVFGSNERFEALESLILERGNFKVSK
jgi:uncharacterized membrane protein YdbT with pleckstrin-like domain